MAQPINRIVINENDLTTAGRQINEDNTVFIVGASIYSDKVTSTYNEMLKPVNYIGELTSGSIEDLLDTTKATTVTTPAGVELINTAQERVYEPELGDVIKEEVSGKYYILEPGEFVEVTPEDYKYESQWLSNYEEICEEGQYFSNFVSQITWKYTVVSKIGRWDKQAKFITFVHDEPMYITSLEELELAIGNKPYRYEQEVAYPEKFFGKGASSDKKALFSPMFKKGDVDPSYVMAKQYVGLGLPVLYLVPSIVEDSDSPVDDIYAAYDNQLMEDVVDPSTGEVTTHYEHIFDWLKDKNTYNVKYVTTGAYPIFEYRAGMDPEKESVPNYDNDDDGAQLTQVVLDLIAARGDCYLLMDEIKCPERPLAVNGNNSELPAPFNKSMFSHVASIGFEHATYAATITTWGIYKKLPFEITELDSETKRLIRLTEIALPNSFGYLSELALSIKNNPAWLAIAGVTRGRVTYLDHLNTIERLTNTIADSYQSKDDTTSLNAITDIKPYGYTIWGNRTLLNNAVKEGLTASSFLNIRNMVCDVKKAVYRACKSLLFEQNNDVLWINFKAQITPLLNRMLSGYGIKDYKITQEQSTEKYKLIATIRLYPIYALEEVEVTIELADEEISVSE